MNVRRLRWIVLALWCLTGPVAAEQTAAPSTAPLAQRLDELDQVDQQLATATQQRAVATQWSQRRALDRQIRELETSQARLLQEIRQLIGAPPPPAVAVPSQTPEAPAALEQQLDTKQQTDDALLERDVSQRLPSK